jgi:hypothetical protein
VLLAVVDQLASGARFRLESLTERELINPKSAALEVWSYSSGMDWV